MYTYNSILSPITVGAVTTATPITSAEFVLNPFNGDPHNTPAGFASLDITFSGSGTLTVTVLCTNGASFVAPEGAVSVIASKSAGHYLAPISIPLCRAFKLVFTATTNTCTVTECIVAVS